MSFLMQYTLVLSIALGMTQLILVHAFYLTIIIKPCNFALDVATLPENW